MSKTNNIIDNTVHTTGSGLSNEFGTLLGNEINSFVKINTGQALNRTVKETVAISNTVTGVKGKLVHLHTGDGLASNPLTTGVGSVDITNKTQMESFSYPVWLDRTSGVGTFGTLKWSAFGTGTEDVALTDGEWDTGGEFAFSNNGFACKAVSKDRDSAGSYYTWDSLRGVGNEIYSDLSNAEFNNIDSLISFDSNGVTLGADTGVNANTSLQRLEQTIYTHLKYGRENGVKWIECYNAITGKAIMIADGSNNVINLPHSLARPIKYRVIKRLNSTDTGFVFHGSADNGMRLYSTTGSNASASTTAWNNTAPTDTHFTLNGNIASTNQSGGVYFHEYSCDTDNVKHITYVGNGGTNDLYDSDGNLLCTLDVPIGGTCNTADVNYIGIFNLEDGKVVTSTFKALEGTESWITYDYQRGEDKYLFLDTSGVEGTADAFTNFNASTTDSLFNLAVDGAVLNLSDTVFLGTDGIGDNGYTIVGDSVATGSIDYSTASSGFNYTYKDLTLGTYGFETARPNVGHYDKESADDNRPIYLDGVNYQPSSVGELVTNGMFDTDTTGWTPKGSATLSVDSGNLKLLTASGGLYAYQQISTEIGETYKFKVDWTFRSDATRPSYFIASSSLPATNLDGDFNSGSENSLGSKEYEFVATSTSTYIVLWYDDGDALDYALYDNVSVFKKASSLGTAYPNPISWLNKKVLVASGTPQDFENADLPLNVIDGLEVTNGLKADTVTAEEFKGVNTITAKCNVDLATTPPDITKSFNIDDVVNLGSQTYSTKFRIYFGEPMDNADYVLTHTRYGTTTSGSYEGLNILEKQLTYVDVLAMRVAPSASNTVDTVVVGGLDIIISGGKN